MAEAGGRWRLAAGLVLLAALMAFGVVAWFVFRGEEAVVQVREAVPIARAPDGPDRERLAEPGGEEIPDQDKRVYDSFGSGAQGETVERLLPAVEQPLPEPQPAPAPAPTVKEMPPPADLPQKDLETVEVEPRGEGGETAAAVPPPPAPPPASTPEPKPAAAPAPATPAATPAAPTGDWQVQLAALRDNAAAMQTWNRISGKQKALLGGMNPDVSRVDTGDRGIFYRLRVGNFGSRAEAETFCGRLKQAGQDCLVAKR
ncbi:MAG: SPOR domain-containing protein [Minwuia sp.]|uniref:SPOR domain-containing protein n=1 Tax=Minwuia sp. TaxID=2493630 RepID=UPI003A8519A8